MSWRGLSRAALDAGYNARASVADFDAEMTRYRSRSAEARATLPILEGLVYDERSGERLDVFPAAPGGPVFLWVHGGYWRALSRADNHFVAPGLVAGGAAVAVMDYTLVPAASLDEIVRQVRAAAAWLARHAGEFGADPARLHVGGSSAGGHLTGMLLADGWQREFGLAPNAVCGGIALSGLFDLEPLRHSYVNDWMGLDKETAARNSPIHHIPSAHPAPRLLAVAGGLETSEFKRQAAEYAAAWRVAGHEAEALPDATHNHFDLSARTRRSHRAALQGSARSHGQPGTG